MTGLLDESVDLGQSGHLPDHDQIAKKLNDLPNVREDYGAIGDTFGTDDSGAFQAAVDDCVVSGDPLYVPPGSYRWDSTVFWAANKVAIIGAGRTITQIRCPASAIGLDIGDGLAIYHYITLRGLDFTRETAGGANTVRLRKIDQFLIQDCSIAAGTGNLRLSECIAGHIDHNQISSQTQYGIQHDNSDQLIFTGNTFETNAGGTTYHFFVQAGNKAIAYVGNVFSTATYALFADGGPSNDCSFTGNTIENCDNGLLIGPVANPAGSRWAVAGNTLRGKAVAGSEGIRVYGAGHSIVGNAVSNYLTRSIAENNGGGGVGPNTIIGNYVDLAPSISNASTVCHSNGLGMNRFPASSTAAASLRLPHGTAPSSPVDGDVWTTTAGLFVRVNGATIGPLS